MASSSKCDEAAGTSAAAPEAEELDKSVVPDTPLPSEHGDDLSVTKLQKEVQMMFGSMEELKEDVKTLKTENE